MSADRRPSFAAIRSSVSETTRRIDALLGRSDGSTPELEILRAIATIRAKGELSGDQGMVLEFVEHYLRKRGAT